MSVKIDRINNEIEKTKGKITEFQSKLRELEKQKTEIENAEIVDTIRGMNISLDDLAVLLKKTRIASGQLDPKSETPQQINKEENE